MNDTQTRVQDIPYQWRDTDTHTEEIPTQTHKDTQKHVLTHTHKVRKNNTFTYNTHTHTQNLTKYTYSYFHKAGNIRSNTHMQKDIKSVQKEVCARKKREQAAGLVVNGNRVLEADHQQVLSAWVQCIVGYKHALHHSWWPLCQTVYTHI